MKEPVFILAAPRSGSTLLFETLARLPGLYTVGDESHQLFDAIPSLHPSRHAYTSNRLTAADATDRVSRTLRANFLAHLRDREGRPARVTRHHLRMLEKTPKNALRIPFLRAIFPDALFIYLLRNPRDNISSIMDGWQSGHFVTYPQLPDWQGPPWSFLLTPGWQEFPVDDLAGVAASQWQITHQTLLKDLEQVPADRICAIRHERLIAQPESEIDRLCRFIGVERDQPITPLPLSRYTLTPPSPDKWQRHRNDLQRVLPGVEPTYQRALEKLQAFQKPALPRQAVYQRSKPRKHKNSSAPVPHSLAITHTAGFPRTLAQLGLSLLISSKNANRLIGLGGEERSAKARLRITEQRMEQPTGSTLSGQHLAIATPGQIQLFRQILEPPSSAHPTSLFLPHLTHRTGQIEARELAWDGHQLWFINQRFSCLCTLDARYSFVPRWRPPFPADANSPTWRITGLGMGDRQPRCISASRQDVDTGLLMDIASGEVLLDGLESPCCPRLHLRQIWWLEKSKGELCTLSDQGEVKIVARLPGLAGALALCGDHAFVGLSIPTRVADAKTASDPVCGVWAVDIRTGKIAGYARFDAPIREIDSISLTRSPYPPAIADPSHTASKNAFFLPPENAESPENDAAHTTRSGPLRGQY